jgi:hypothetical protein
MTETRDLCFDPIADRPSDISFALPIDTFTVFRQTCNSPPLSKSEKDVNQFLPSVVLAVSRPQQHLPRAIQTDVPKSH